MKKISIQNMILIAAAACLTACGGGNVAPKKLTDWEKLNLKDSVQELTEGNSRYTVFNESGYIVEKGNIEKEQKRARETREYDENQNLAKRTFSESIGSYLGKPMDAYSVETFDSKGRIVEKQHFEYIYSRQQVEQRYSLKYRYEDSGNTETHYFNDKIVKTVEYDSHHNVATETTFNDRGEKNTLTEYERKYDRAGNILTQTSFLTRYPLPENYNKKFRFGDRRVSAYDENNRLIRYEDFRLEPTPVSESKVEMKARSLGTTVISYDSEGNDTQNGSVSYEYDHHSNWIILYRNGKMSQTRDYRYFNEAEGAGEEYYEED